MKSRDHCTKKNTMSGNAIGNRLKERDGTKRDDMSN